MDNTNNTYTSASGFLNVTDTSGTAHSIPWSWSNGEFTISNGVSFEAISDLLTLVSSRVSIVEHHITEDFSSNVEFTYAQPFSEDAPATLMHAEALNEMPEEVVEEIVKITSEPEVSEAPEPVVAETVVEKPVEKEPVEEKAAQTTVKRRRGRPKKSEATPEPEAKIAGATQKRTKKSAAPAATSSVPQELLDAKSLKSVVKHFIDMGVTDSEQIYQQCCDIKTEVPILARAANLNTRIDRISQVFLGAPNGG